MSTGSEYRSPVVARPRSVSRSYLGSSSGSGTQRDGASRHGASQRTAVGHYSGPTHSRLHRTGAAALGQDSARQLVHVNVRPSEARPPQVLRFHRHGGPGYPHARRVATGYTQRTNSSLPLGTLPESPGSDAVPRRDGGHLGLDATAPIRHSPPAEYAPPAPNHAASNHANADEANEAGTNGDAMANDDPRNPFKNHRNSVFYNMYPPRGRQVVRPPPGTGYGTRYFQNGEFI